MLGTNIGSVGWPASGEIDIMEHINFENITHGTIHWDSGGHASYGGATPGIDVTQYHLYGIEWDQNAIRWYIDGAKYFEANIQNSINSTEEFHRPFFLILNLAMGGAWPGNPNAQTASTQTLRVDYIRVYQQGTTPPPPPPGGIDSTRWYDVVNANSGKCVDARAAGTANGTAIQQYDCNNSFAQHFQFQPTSGGYYRVNQRNNAAQVWDVSGVNMNDGGLIQLWAYGGGNNQQWLPQQNANGTWRFIARHSGKCLDVPGSSTANSVQLQQWTCNGTNAQNFTLRVK
jgi:hypothetical protein